MLYDETNVLRESISLRVNSQERWKYRDNNIETIMYIEKCYREKLTRILNLNLILL